MGKLNESVFRSDGTGPLLRPATDSLSAVAEPPHQPSATARLDGGGGQTKTGGRRGGPVRFHVSGICASQSSQGCCAGDLLVTFNTA